MASITDCVSEGLKYPFNDIRKLLSLGALFAILSLLSFAITETFIQIFRIIAKSSGETLALKLSQVPSNNIYFIGALAIISFIISLIIMGYEYNVIKFSIERKEALPEFCDILSLIINGLKFLVVIFVYNIIPIIVLIAGVELLSIQNGDYLVSILSFILFIICNFLLIMALTNMVDSNKFAKAFDLRDIIDKISNLGWIKYIGIIIFTIIIYAIIMFAVEMILMIISTVMAISISQATIILAVISIIQGLFISSYISIFLARVYGSVYREAIK